MANSQNQKALSIFSLVMITVGSVDSVRNLPATALFGTPLIFFFLLAGAMFLIPSGLVSAELASGWPERGGVYAWVKAAMGAPLGLMAIWFQWIENVIWYPTLLSFIAGTLAYLVAPELAHHRFYLVSVILVVFWSVTLLNLRGIKTSAFFSNFCALAGLILPMALIIALGAIWLLMGKPSHIQFHMSDVIPHLRDPNMLVSLTGVILCYCGMEITTVHATDVRNPQRDYPIALLISVVIIMLTLIAGALSIAIVLPADQMSLVAGLMQAFSAFFQAYGLNFLIPVMAVLIVIGGLGGLNSWIIAPSRGLQVALSDLQLAPGLYQENTNGAPKGLLLVQAVVCSLVSTLFITMPSVNSTYWLLTVLASQLYMFMYILMFIAGIILRYKQTQVERSFRIPFGNAGMWAVSSIGIIACVCTIVIGFHPPEAMHIRSPWLYQLTLLTGLILLSCPPLILYYRREGRWPTVSSEQA